ncbi:membrane protein [soil metagenome]
MTDSHVIDTVVLDPQREQSLRTVGLISYALHTIVAICAVVPGVQASIVLLLVAVVIDLVKRDDALGSWQASHFSWRLKSVLFAGLAYLLTAPLFLLLFVPGWIAWMLISVWFLYRIVRGWTAMNAGRAMGA